MTVNTQLFSKKPHFSLVESESSGYSVYIESEDRRIAKMQVSANYFNAHANANRIMGTKATNSLGVVHQANPAPAIIKADEVAYARAMERAAMGKRKAKVTMQKSPWE